MWNNSCPEVEVCNWRFPQKSRVCCLRFAGVSTSKITMTVRVASPRQRERKQTWHGYCRPIFWNYLEWKSFPFSTAWEPDWPGTWSFRNSSMRRICGLIGAAGWELRVTRLGSQLAGIQPVRPSALRLLARSEQGRIQAGGNASRRHVRLIP